MSRLWLNGVASLAFVVSSVALSHAQESVRSSPKDTTPYARPAIPEDAAGAQARTGVAGAPVNIVRVVDTVVNNTDPNLKTTDTFNDGETSIAINPSNPLEIVISAFSGSWGANAPLWHSTDDGQTWTKRFTIPVPPGVAGAAGCPCDQTFDYGRNNVLFGTFLTESPDNLVTGSTTNPDSAAAWQWWLVGGVAQLTNSVATSIGNADQPWMLHNRGLGSGTNEDVYVAYDDFGTTPVNMRVAASINFMPPQFPAGSDKLAGSSSGAINPGHRLAQDPCTGWMYSLQQNCITNCASLAANPKTLQYILNRSVDEGATWSLNGSAAGIIVATADSTQPQPKFGTVNALLGGVLHAAVDPTTGDLYYVYGNRDASGNNRLAIRRVFDNGSGGVTVGTENLVVSGTVTAALPQVAVNNQGMVGVFYYTFNGMVGGFPQFSTWLATSTDQGATFNTQPLATFLSPAVDNADPRQRVFGDYMQMKAVANCFYGSFTGNGAAFGRATSNNDPIFFKACGPSPPSGPPVCSLGSQLGDLNGDGKDDIVFRRVSDGEVVVYLMNGFQILSAQVIGNVGTDFTLTAVADFNGDGKADLLFRRVSDGLIVMYLMNGPQVLQATVVGSLGTDWEYVGSADFDGDGKADILFRRVTDGMLALYLMNGTQVLSATLLGTVGNDFRVRGVRDFNGDGRADILFRRVSDGMLALYEFNGPQLLAAQLLGAVGTDFEVVGARDFNGDGRADILFRRASDGMVALFLMNGFQVAGAQLLGAVGQDITIQGVGDFNGDGRSDILFRRVSDGLLVIYLMNGFQILALQSLGAVGTDFTICYGQPPFSVVSEATQP